MVAGYVGSSLIGEGFGAWFFVFELECSSAILLNCSLADLCLLARVLAVGGEGIRILSIVGSNKMR